MAEGSMMLWFNDVWQWRKDRAGKWVEVVAENGKGMLAGA
jgi:hypothetical protein